MNSKVMVTGAGGFLGQQTANRLKFAGFDVVGIARQDTVGLVGCDLSQPDTVWNLLNQERPHVIVNCAVSANWGEDVLPELYPINVLMPAVLAAWARSAGAYLIHISGSLVCGSGAEFVSIQSPVSADTDYGRSKLLAEEAILASGVASVILRFGGIFGALGPDHLGLNRAIRGAKSGKRPTIVGSGLAKRNYIHVSDAAAAIEYYISNRLEGIHFCANHEVLSLSEIFQSLCDVYLPGSSPEIKAGNEARDQVTEPSQDLPATLLFRQALDSEV